MGIFDGSQNNQNNKKATPVDETEFLNDLAGDGLEVLTAEDIKVPFLKILQDDSPQCKPNKPEYIEGAKPGCFFNTITGKVYPSTLQMIPVVLRKSWVEWKPKRGGFVAKHEPYSIEIVKRSFTEWEYNGNEIKLTFEFYVLLVDHMEDGPMVFAMSSSGIRHAQNWNTMIMNVRLNNGSKAPYYSSVWEVSTTYVNGDKGDYYQIGDKTSLIKRIRFITRKDLELFVGPTKESVNDLAAHVDYKQIESSSSGETVQGSSTEVVPY